MQLMSALENGSVYLKYLRISTKSHNPNAITVTKAKSWTEKVKKAWTSLSQVSSDGKTQICLQIKLEFQKYTIIWA